MKRIKTVRHNLKGLASSKGMTSRDDIVPLTPIEPIEPILSSEEDQFGSYGTYMHREEENESLSEKENQKQLTANLRILERQRGIEQFITSEEKYCNHLKKLINLYLEPLSKHLSPPNQSTLFGDISTIYQKNVTFSITLEQKYKAFDPSSTLIGNDVLKFIPNLRVLYQNYVNRHEQASKLLTSLETDSKFIKICDGALVQLKIHKNGLAAATADKEVEFQSIETLKYLLLLPIERVAKYESSLRDIMTNTDESHDDYHNLQQCVHDITIIHQLIADKMREFSERQVVRKIANSIKGNTSFNLETPYRKFIKNGYLIKMGKTKPQRYLFFLFNDLLFYCKKVGHVTTPTDTISAKADTHIREDSGSHSAEDELHINIGQTSSVAHDYSDTSDLNQITALFGDSRSRPGGRSRKSRTKLFTETDASLLSDGGAEPGDELSMTSFGMNVDIHNEIDVFSASRRNIGQFKVHNAMPIDMVFDVKDLRIFPQRYDNKAFEIRSSVKSFIVVAESERAKKEWMSLLEHCTNAVLQQSLANKSVTLGSGSSTPGVHGNSVSVSERSKMKRFAATLYLPNNFTEQCMKCGKQFGYSRRKNHCHHCGWLICSKCLTEKLPSFDSIKGAPNYEKSKGNTTFKVCGDCYGKNKHLFPEFEEASVLSTNAKSKIFAYKQKSKRKQNKKKNKNKGKKSKFIKIFKQQQSNKTDNLSEDVENDFYEKGSLVKKEKEEIKNEDGGGGGIIKEEEEADEVDNEEDEEEYDNSDIEPSMHSIPEHDDRIDTIIYGNEYEGSVSSHLAPHWTPHATVATSSGHHNRDYSSNLNDTGYADNDSDSRSDSDDSDDRLEHVHLTPPLSDADTPLSPYYDDTPLLTETGKGPFDVISPPDGLSPKLAEVRAMRLRPTNSLNMADVLDELEREQEERREEEQEVEDENEEEEVEEEEDDDDDGYEAEPVSASDANPMMQRPSTSLLRAIPEYEDTDDDNTSANDVDPETAYEHLRNLSTHIEDYEYRDITPPLDDATVDETSIVDGSRPSQYSKLNALKIMVQKNGSQEDVPGNTPPPLSPRYMKLGAAHKRRLSDKLDKFLTDRPNPPQLIQRQILYTTPQEDIDSLKEKIQVKREERERIKKRLKRKLSHDFRPSEQDIQERGIKIMPQMVILSDEEDADEEIIVYDNPNSRDSFSLQKKKSFEKENTAYYLEKERQRNSQRIKVALVERPTPSDMIERGYISAQKVNEHIPPKDIREQILRLRAEYSLQLMDNKEYRMEKERLAMRRQRRCKILTFYDDYLFDPNPNRNVDIDSDYNAIIETVAGIKQEDISLEKEWMRNLRKRKFKTYVGEHTCGQLETKRKAMRAQLNELMDQIQIVVSTKQIDSMTNEIDRLEKERCSFLTSTTQQMDRLRNIIKDLSKVYPTQHQKKNNFLSVS